MVHLGQQTQRVSMNLFLRVHVIIHRRLLKNTGKSELSLMGRLGAGLAANGI